MNGKKYDVFLSYAHADAQTEEQTMLVAQIKDSIEKSLKGVAAKGENSYVFLDSEALRWGDEWSAKIRACIDDCRVFVYLLSPNYLRSNYCQREKLWWAKREIDNGRLNKATRPIYYISLPLTGDEQTDRYIRELKICQADDRPFFESLDKVKCEVISNRLEAIKQGIKDQFKANEAADSLCTVYPRISKYFVGRLKELADLNELCCEKRTIPVISGPAGIGKSELAVAYAYAYAENFPQGRFMIPMQGVKNWAEAMDKMVEKIRECDESPTEWGFPEDYAKHAPEERLSIARMWLRNRAKQGCLLLVLDNLEKLELISDSGLEKLFGIAGMPENLRMIATTRLKEKPYSGRNARQFYELDRLSDKDAMEMFCLIGENIFPFARWPMTDDGKILLDRLPSDKKRPLEKDISEIEEEYELNTGRVIADWFESRNIDYNAVPAVLVHSHGPFTWGKNADAAAKNSAILEEVAKMAYLSEQLGAAPASQAIRKKHYMRKHGPNAYYGQK